MIERISLAGLVCDTNMDDSIESHCFRFFVRFTNPL
jgi:hypothetical protein